MALCELVRGLSEVCLTSSFLDLRAVSVEPDEELASDSIPESIFWWTFGTLAGNSTPNNLFKNFKTGLKMMTWKSSPIQRF